MAKPLSKLIFDRSGVVLFLAATTIITFITIYLVQQPVFKTQYAAPEASLTLVPRNIAQRPDGSWQITEGQEVIVDVVLDSSIHQIEAVEATIQYDPSVLLANEESGSISCNELTSLKYAIQPNFDNSQGQANITCTAVTTENRDTYEPLPAQFVGTVATLTFTAIKTAQDTAITIDFNPDNPRNDSNVLEYEGQCCSVTDVLLSVENIEFDVVPQDSMPTLSLAPASLSVSENQPFNVDIVLSTGPYEVDGADVILEYDTTKLRAESVTASTLFDEYVKTPLPSGISESAGIGRVSLSGFVAASVPSGVQGDDLVFGTVRFTPLESGIATVSFYTDPQDSRNDTNISEFGQSNDLLEYTVPGIYVISDISITPTPTINEPRIYLSPDSHIGTVGVPFDVNVHVSTAGEPIDAVDAVIEYDPEVFVVEGVGYGSVFDEHVTNPDIVTGPEANGRISLSGLMEPGSEPVIGNNLLLGRLTLIPTSPSIQSTVTLVFTGAGQRNDSNISSAQEEQDILASVGNALYSVLDTGAEIISSIRLILALEGRTEGTVSKQRDFQMRILNTHFDSNPVEETTDIAGEVTLTNTHLEDRMVTGMYDALIKPLGYLQQRFSIPLLQTVNTIDLTDQPFSAGDFDGSGEINVLDWRMYLEAFNTADELTDINGSGEVNALDNVYIISNWNQIDEQ